MLTDTNPGMSGWLLGWLLYFSDISFYICEMGIFPALLNDTSFFGVGDQQVEGQEVEGV